ncbi:MAG: hypothetical protein ACTSX1_04875, partial [Candidatus Heimdallarchaeaceae archaeon]
MFKAIIIYLSMFAGLFLMLTGGYILVSEMIQPADLLFQGIMTTAAGITLLMVVLIASTIGKVVMLFDEILNQTTNLYETMLRQERNKPPRNPFSGMFNSVTIKNKETGEENT